MPNPEPKSTLRIPPLASLANSQSMALEASLALWRYTAEKVISKNTRCTDTLFDSVTAIDCMITLWAVTVHEHEGSKRSLYLTEIMHIKTYNCPNACCTNTLI